MFNCPTCKRSMRPLFTSYYCDVCDPTATATGKGQWGTLHLQASGKKFLYRLLKDGDIMPVFALSGWHCIRKTRATGYLIDETDSDIAIRVARELENSPHKSSGGWPLADYGAQPGHPIKTLTGGKNDFLMVTKPEF